MSRKKSSIDSPLYVMLSRIFSSSSVTRWYTMSKASMRPCGVSVGLENSRTTGRSSSSPSSPAASERRVDSPSPSPSSASQNIESPKHHCGRKAMSVSSILASSPDWSGEKASTTYVLSRSPSFSAMSLITPCSARRLSPGDAAPASASPPSPSPPSSTRWPRETTVTAAQGSTTCGEPGGTNPSFSAAVVSDLRPTRVSAAPAGPYSRVRASRGASSKPRPPMESKRPCASTAGKAAPASCRRTRRRPASATGAPLASAAHASSAVACAPSTVPRNVST